MDKIPFWEKYTLSIDEAAAYFRIGRDKLYKFEEYIDRLNVI